MLITKNNSGVSFLNISYRIGLFVCAVEKIVHVQSCATFKRQKDEILKFE